MGVEPSRIMMQVRDAARPLTFGPRIARPLQKSAATPWSGLPFEVHRLRSVDEVGESGPLPGEAGLLVVTRGAYDTTLRGPRGDLRSRARAGTIHLLSGDARPYVLRIEGDAEVVALHLDPAWRAYLPGSPAELGRHGPVDGGRTARALVAAIRGEVARGCGAGRLYAESISLAFLDYVASLLPDPERVASDAEGALSAPERARLVDYVDANLDKGLSLTTLAAVVGMSRRRFTTRFRATFGASPHDYVTRARLERGARLLAGGRHEIVEIALRTGFCSQSHFTTAFRRAFGETPHRYARARAVPRPRTDA